MNTNKTPKVADAKDAAKLSPAMVGAMLRATEHDDGQVEAGVNTVVALIDRGLASAGTENFLTPAGWTWLETERGVVRPPDAGRATLEEARELAFPHNANVDAVDAWMAAMTAQDRERREAGRLTVEQAIAEVDEDEGRYPFTVLIGRHVTYFNDRASADSYAAQYSGSIVATKCVLGDSPDSPCPNPVIGARYATASPLPGCAYHLGH